MLDKGEYRYVKNIVASDEICLCYYAGPTQSQNKIWAFEGDVTPVVFRKSQSVEKKMIDVFFELNVIVQLILLETEDSHTLTVLT